MEQTASLWQRCGEWAGLSISQPQVDLLVRYRDWLIEEAIPSGGLGPNEAERVDLRHIADSLLFATGFPAKPELVLDVGSGVGLPGIPLAVVLPEVDFVLLDRSGRRVELLRRVVRILQLDNVEVVKGEVAAWETPVDVIVSRASLNPDQARHVFPGLLRSGGVAVLGGSWASPPQVEGVERVEVPAGVLDQPVWLLIMPPSEQ